MKPINTFVCAAFSFDTFRIKFIQVYMKYLSIDMYRHLNFK